VSLHVMHVTQWQQLGQNTVPRTL